MGKCQNCDSEYYSPTRTVYCEKCRPIMRKKKHAEQEKARRERKKDEINAKRREEYHNNPARKKMCNEASRRSYEKHMNDPNLKQGLNERARIAQVKYRNKTKFGGNATKALERDKYKCVECNSTEMLAIHHLDGDGSNLPVELQNNSLDNLITLCFSCHARVHRKKEKENKTSKYIGVWKRKDSWQAQIRHKGKRYYLGTFKTEEEAFNAYISKNKELNNIKEQMD